MPTGYTSVVADGTVTDLRTFAMRCARGMGAMISMRDEPLGAEIPERFEPSDYHSNALGMARAERERLYAMSDQEAAVAARAEFDEKSASEAKWKVEKAETRQRYMAMIDKVSAWQKAPDGLKGFMLEQLRTGMDFDAPARDDYYDKAELLTGPDWRAKRLEKVERDILYHAKHDAEERARVESRNAWLAQLRIALHEIETADA